MRSAKAGKGAHAFCLLVPMEGGGDAFTADFRALV